MMLKKELQKTILLGVVAAVIAAVIASFLFHPVKRNVSIPGVVNIKSTIPDVKNDPAYQSIFNNKSIDPTQPVQIGNNSNNSPFSR